MRPFDRKISDFKAYKTNYPLFLSNRIIVFLNQESFVHKNKSLTTDYFILSFVSKYKNDQNASLEIN
jgi:hypothetical protein